MRFETGPTADRNDEPEASVAKIEDAGFTVIWAASILPGKTEAWRRFMQELKGNRQQDFDDACQRFAIFAIRSWVTETTKGDIGVIAVIAAHPDRVMTQLAVSDFPFDRWFRDQLAALQGLDITTPPLMPPSDLVLDWSKPREGGVICAKSKD